MAASPSETTNRRLRAPASRRAWRASSMSAGLSSTKRMSISACGSEPFMRTLSGLRQAPRCVLCLRARPDTSMRADALPHGESSHSGRMHDRYGRVFAPFYKKLVNHRVRCHTGVAGAASAQMASSTYAQHRSARAPSSAAVLAAAAVLFIAILALKVSVRTPGFGFPLLYDIPVALLAIAFGVRGGLAAAAVGMALFGIGDATGEIHPNVWGYPSRALSFVVLGSLLGLYSDRLRRAEARTRASEAHFRASLDDSPVVVWRQDPKLRYTWIDNPLLGFSAAEALGKTDAELLDRDTARRVPEVKQEVLRTGNGRRIELETGHGGDPAYFDLTVNPLRDGAGEVAGVTGTATDITELKRMQAELRESRE